MREVLYYVARATPATDHVREVQESLPSGADASARRRRGERREDSPALKSARELLGQAKDAWNKFASGNAAALPAFATARTRSTTAAAALGNADLAALAQRNRRARRLARDATAEDERGGRARSRDRAAADRERAGRIRRSLGRVRAAVAGRLRSPQGLRAGQAAAHASRRFPCSTRCRARRRNACSMNQVVDGNADQLAQHRAGARRVLPRSREARRTGVARTSRCVSCSAHSTCSASSAPATRSRGGRADIRRFSERRLCRGPQDFERLAQTLSGLGFYIEALAHGKADFDAAMRPIVAARSKRRNRSSPQVATVEAQIAEQQRETAALYEEWKKKPEDAARSGRAAQESRRPAKGRRSGRRLEAGSLGRARRCKALDKAATMPLTPFRWRGDREDRTATGAPAPSPEAAKLMRRQRRSGRRGAAGRLPGGSRRGSRDDTRAPRDRCASSTPTRRRSSPLCGAASIR